LESGGARGISLDIILIFQYVVVAFVREPWSSGTVRIGDLATDASHIAG